MSAEMSSNEQDGLSFAYYNWPAEFSWGTKTYFRKTFSVGTKHP